MVEEDTHARWNAIINGNEWNFDKVLELCKGNTTCAYWVIESVWDTNETVEPPKVLQTEIEKGNIIETNSGYQVMASPATAQYLAELFLSTVKLKADLENEKLVIVEPFLIFSEGDSFVKICNWFDQYLVTPMRDLIIERFLEERLR